MAGRSFRANGGGGKGLNFKDLLFRMHLFGVPIELDLIPPSAWAMPRSEKGPVDASHDAGGRNDANSAIFQQLYQCRAQISIIE